MSLWSSFSQIIMYWDYEMSFKPRNGSVRHLTQYHNYALSILFEESILDDIEFILYEDDTVYS